MAADDDRPAIMFGQAWPSLTAGYALAVHGVEIWVCAPSRFPAAYLRGAGYAAAPDPATDEAGAIDALCRLARGLSAPPVVFPGGDKFAQALARHRDRLDDIATCCVADAETIDRVVDKRRFALWARRHAPSHPRSIAGDRFRPGPDMPFPVAAKVAFSGWSDIAAYGHPPANFMSRIGFTVLHDVAAWEAYRRKWEPVLPFILIQPFVEGDTRDMYSVGLYVDRATTINAIFVGRKLRGFPPRHGNATACRNDHVPAQVIAEVEDIVERLKLTGIMEFEYKRDRVSGQFHLMEINLRPWLLIGGSAATAANIPYAAYRDLCGRPLAPVRVNDAAVRVTYALLIDDFRVATRLGRRYGPAHAWSLLGWWKSLRAERRVFLDLNRHTWPVALHYVTDGVVKRLFRDPYHGIRRIVRSAAGAVSLAGDLNRRLFDRHLIRFDRRHNIDTAYPERLDGLTIDSPMASHGQAYRAVPESVFGAAISALPADLSRFTFVDFGSGKGRALILAARAGFGRVIGVEFAAELHRIATANAARYTAVEGGPAIDCRHCDATEFPIPDGPAVFFFHNPFDEPVMARVMANIRAAHDRSPREMYVLYAHPRFAVTVEQQGIFRRVARVRPRTLLRHRYLYETLIYTTAPETA